jgi:hypothetical protein
MQQHAAKLGYINIYFVISVNNIIISKLFNDDTLSVHIFSLV